MAKNTVGANALNEVLPNETEENKQLSIVAFGINKLRQEISVKEFIRTQDRFLFNDPCQRNADAWDIYRKSLLIHSVIMGIPVPNVYVQMIEDKYNIIDGKQRLTTLKSFVENKFGLHSETPPITIKTESTEETEFSIANATFKALPVEFQDRINAHTIVLEVLQMNDEIKNIVFDRLNQMEPLTPQERLRSIMAISLSDFLVHAAKHEFIEKISMSERRKNRGGDHEVILQSMLVIEKKGDTGIGSVDIKEWVKDGVSEDTRKVFEHVMEYLNEAVSHIDKKLYKDVLKKTHVPMLFLTALEAKDISTEEFAKWMKSFLSERYKDGKYKDFASFGSARKDNASARSRLMIKDFRNHFNLSE